MLKTNVDASGLLNRFDRLNKNLNSLPWPQAGKIAQDSINQNFIQQGRPKKWAPRKVRYPWPPLQKTGKLKNSIDSKPVRNGVSVGTRGVSYAKFLQKGTRKMKARPFVLIHPDDAKDIKELIKKHIIK